MRTPSTKRRISSHQIRLIRRRTSALVDNTRIPDRSKVITLASDLEAILDHLAEVHADLDLIKNQNAHLLDRLSQVEAHLGRSTQAGAGEIPACLMPLAEKLKRYVFPQTTHCCVYFLISGCEIVYIGMSRDLTVRLATHFANGTGKPFDYALFMEIDPRKAGRFEIALIRHFLPQINESCKSGKKPVDVAALAEMGF